jgi:hypothetical protein
MEAWRAAPPEKKEGYSKALKLLLEVGVLTSRAWQPLTTVLIHHRIGKHR